MCESAFSDIIKGIDGLWSKCWVAPRSIQSFILQRLIKRVPGPTGDCHKKETVSLQWHCILVKMNPIIKRGYKVFFQVLFLCCLIALKYFLPKSNFKNLLIHVITSYYPG